MTRTDVPISDVEIDAELEALVRAGTISRSLDPETGEELFRLTDAGRRQARAAGIDFGQDARVSALAEIVAELAKIASILASDPILDAPIGHATPRDRLIIARHAVDLVARAKAIAGRTGS